MIGYTAKLLGGLIGVFVYDCRAENGFCFWALSFHCKYLQFIMVNVSLKFFAIIRIYILHYFWGKAWSTAFSHGGDESIVYPGMTAILHTAFLGSSMLIILVV